MKMITGAVSRKRLGTRHPSASNSECHAAGEVARDLFNQLTVINLCFAHLAASVRATCDAGVAADLDILERAAEEATRLAERVAQLIGERKTLAATPAPKSPTPPAQVNKVLRLF